MVFSRGGHGMQDSSIRNARIHAEITVSDLDFRNAAACIFNPGPPLRLDLIRSDSVLSVYAAGVRLRTPARALSSLRTAVAADL